MMLRRVLARPRSIYNEYPSQFWILILGTFIDRIGGALIYPFFTLYVTRKFGITMTKVGLIFGLFAISSVVGSTLGGALTVGEMMTAPVSQSLVSQMAPEAMRGRYMAAYGFSWVIPSALGPTLAGVVMDTTDPRWVWLGTGVIGLLAAWVFLLVRRRAGQSFEVADEMADVELGPQGEAPEHV